MNTFFLGSPHIAIQFLDTLRILTNVSLIITQPDKKKGRGHSLSPCPLKEYALDKELCVESPMAICDIQNDIQKQKFDFGLAVAYGQIISDEIIKSTKYGILNVHFSMLPSHRGASPVQYTLLNGDTKTGVTIFWIDKGMDTGDIFKQRDLKIEPSDNAKTLMNKLINTALPLLEETIKDIRQGKVIRRRQQGKASLAPKISKEETFVNFKNETAQNIHNKIRAFALTPYARTYIHIDGKKILLQLIHSKLYDGNKVSEEVNCGEIIAIERPYGFLVKCKDTILSIDRIKPEGKTEMSAYDFFNGMRSNLRNIKFTRQ